MTEGKSGLVLSRLIAAMASDEEVFRLLYPDENGLTLMAERIAARYERLSKADAAMENNGYSRSSDPRWPTVVFVVPSMLKPLDE